MKPLKKKKLFWSKGWLKQCLEGVIRSYRELHNEELRNLYLFPKPTKDYSNTFHLPCINQMRKL